MKVNVIEVLELSLELSWFTSLQVKSSTTFNLLLQFSSSRVVNTGPNRRMNKTNLITKRRLLQVIILINLNYFSKMNAFRNVAIGRTTEKVCKAYTQLKRESAIIGFRINEDERRSTCLPETQTIWDLSVLVDGDNLEVVKERSVIRRRIVQVNRACYGLHRLLRSRRLRARTKC